MIINAIGVLRPRKAFTDVITDSTADKSKAMHANEERHSIIVLSTVVPDSDAPTCLQLAIIIAIAVTTRIRNISKIAPVIPPTAKYQFRFFHS